MFSLRNRKTLKTIPPKAEEKQDDAKTLGLSDEFFEKSFKLTDRGLDIDYTLDHCIYVDDNHTLEIEPGVTIMMASNDACIEIRENGSLKIKGTAEKPVVFKTPDGASWNGITVWSKNKNNVISHTKILNVGSENHALYVTGEARLAVDHVTIDGSEGNGVWIDGDARFIKFTGNTIKNCKKYPLVLATMRNTENIANDNVFENNKKQFIDVENKFFSTNEDFTIPKLALPYYLNDGLGIESDASTVTISAGVEMRFNHATDMDVRDGVLLKIDGTTDAPVVMQGINDEEAFWSGVFIDSSRPSEIANLTLKNTGYSDYASLNIRGESKLTLTNIAFKATPKTCLSISNGAKLTNGGGISFENCAEANIFDERIDGDDDQRKLKELPDPVRGADLKPAAETPSAE